MSAALPTAEYEYGDIVAQWTGMSAYALQRALRMTHEQFAEHLGVARRTTAAWRARPDLIPLESMQVFLDSAYERTTPEQRARFRLLISEPELLLRRRPGRRKAGGTS